jgi:small subunit ribosomal protein S18
MRMYRERYQRHAKQKEKTYSLQVPKDTLEQELDRVEHGDSASSIVCHSKKKNLEKGIVAFDQEESDLPVNLKEDPFTKKIHQCVFCKYNIPLDYKNTQLLSQFVSQHTGIIYSQEVTGLCVYKYKELEATINKSRRLGLMPFFYKETVFLSDPELFDPYRNNLKPIPNNYDRRKLNADPADNDTKP